MKILKRVALPIYIHLEVEKKCILKLPGVRVKSETFLSTKWTRKSAALYPKADCHKYI